MANDASAAHLIHTRDKYLSVVEDALSDEMAEFYWLKNKSGGIKTGQGGRGRRWLARMERGEVSGFARDTRLEPARVSRNQEARLTNKGIASLEMLSYTDQLENKGEEEIISHMQDMMDGMTNDFYDSMTKMFYDVGGSTSALFSQLGWIGIEGSLLATGSYADINVVTYPGWAGNVLSGGVYAQFSTDPLKAINAALRACRSGGAKGAKSQLPDVCFLSPANYDIMFERFFSQQVLGKNKDAMDAEFYDHFVYNGVTFFKSDYVGQNGMTSNCVIIASKTLQVNCPGQFILTKTWTENVPMADYVLMMHYGHLQCKNPRRNARIVLA